MLSPASTILSAAVQAAPANWVTVLVKSVIAGSAMVILTVLDFEVRSASSLIKTSKELARSFVAAGATGVLSLLSMAWLALSFRTKALYSIMIYSSELFAPVLTTSPNLK